MTAFRRATQADIDLHETWFLDPELARRLSAPTPEWRAFLASGAQTVWVSVDADDCPLAVFILEKDDAGAAWLAFAIEPSQRGKGLMTAILRAFVAGPGADFARLIGEVELDNAASIALLRRCGFAEIPGAGEGLLRFERPSPRAQG
jgi:RimJ/RimL family protein N-acetyltransferase